MKKATLQLETLTCPTCVTKIEGAVRNMNGIEQVGVLFNASKLKATFDETVTSADEIVKTVENLGYSVEKVKVA